MPEKLAAFLGFVTLFNIVAAVQNFVKFSASYVWIGEWWRYVTSYLFLSIPFDVSIIEKDMWTIMLVIFGLALRYTLGDLGAFRSLEDARSAIRLILDDHKSMISRFGKHDFGTVEVLYIQFFSLVILAITSIAWRLSYSLNAALGDDQFSQIFFIYASACTFGTMATLLMSSERKYSNKDIGRFEFFVRAVMAVLYLPIFLIAMISGLFLAGFVQSFPNAHRLGKYLGLFLVFLLFGWLAEVLLDPYLSKELAGWPRAPLPVA